MIETKMIEEMAEDILSLSLSIWHCSLVLALILGLFVLFNKPAHGSVDIPTVKYSRFLPNFVNRLVYNAVGARLIDWGYEKYRDTPFRVLKADGDLVILPARYINELRNSPPAQMSSLDAQFHNVLGQYTHVLAESRLPSFTVMKRLNPSIGRLVPMILDELKYAFEVDVPKCEDDWISVNAYNMLHGLLTRSTSRVMVGETICRNPQWLETVTNYTINVGIIVILLRPFPKFLRPLIAKFLPSVRKINEQIRFVKEELFIPMINARRHAEYTDSSYKKPDDFLQWMMELANNPRDKEPDFMAHNLFVIMSLAVVHTSTMLMTHMLYDLVEMPEYLGPLREEIQATLPDGWVNATQASFNAQHRMDSFMKEVQRFNPTGEVSMHRMLRQPITLSDGLTLPKGTHICFASGPLCRDPDIVSNPFPFDGFRWAKDPESKTNKFVSIGPANMHFGFGRQACPGRFLASCAIKAIMSRVLMKYDVKYEDGQKRRPRNIRNGEQIVPHLWTNVLIRKRKDVSI